MEEGEFSDDDDDLSNSHSKFPTIWTIFFNSQLHLTIPFCIFNSLILQYLPHVTHFPTHQTKRRVSHNTSPLSVEGYTKPSAELEINVDVKYVGEDERTSHSKFPTIWTIFFNSQLHLAIPFCLFNSLILQYLPHVTHFPKSLPLSHFPQTVLKMWKLGNLYTPVSQTLDS
jgi:hypothetical protein